MASLLLAIIYLAFISLGLPDALLGSAWPYMYQQFDVPLSYAGLISMIISLGTVVSALMSDRLTRRLGTGLVTTISVAMTAVALLGFSVSSAYWMLLLWAIPYGLGAGSVDASLNNYVALHYASRHMSWLHAMWGVGISIGPYIMSYALTHGAIWNSGYRTVFILQVVLTTILILSLPLWKKRPSAPANASGQKQEGEDLPAEEETSPIEKAEETAGTKPLTLRQILSLPGAMAILIAFFCYSAVEQTTILWGSSFLVLSKGVSADLAASFASMFCIGITIGRIICGFLTLRFNDTQMIRLGALLITLGVVFLFLPFGPVFSVVGLMIVGFGCAPIYPCIIHSTPAHFGAENSQAVIGIQMAFGYIGTTLMPPLFGLIANHISITLFPAYLLIFLVLLAFMYEIVVRKTEKA